MKYCTLSHHTFRLLGPHTCRLRLAASAKLSQVFSDEPAVTMPTMSCAEIVSNCMKASKPGRIVEAMLEMPLVRSPLCFGSSTPKLTQARNAATNNNHAQS